MAQKAKNKLKQCFLQFDNGSYSTLWIPVENAVENKEIKIENRVLNINSMAKILKVYHLVVLDAN